MKSGVNDQIRPATVRVFIALAPPDHAKEELAQELRPAYDTHPNLRWNRIEDWHITLAFLGELPVETVPRLRPPLAELAADHRPPLWHCAAAATSTTVCCGAESTETSMNCTSSPPMYGPPSGTAGSPSRNDRSAPT